MENEWLAHKEVLLNKYRNSQTAKGILIKLLNKKDEDAPSNSDMDEMLQIIQSHYKEAKI